MIKYITGDITDATEEVIAHGVNCQGKFDSGVAGAIKLKHPAVRNAYLQLDEHILGTCQFVNHNNQIWINAHTQDRYGYDNKPYADLTAIAYCFMDIVTYMELNRLTSIAMPKIGCGLGGLQWPGVEMLIDDIFSDIDVTVYEL